MKKIAIFIILIVIVVTSLSMNGCTDKTDETAPAPDRAEEQTITYEKNPDVNDPMLIGVPNVTLPPMIMWDKDGNLTGFEIELIEETAKRLGVRFEIVPINPGTEQEMLESKTIDCVWGNMADSEKQNSFYGMTDPYITIPQVITVYEGLGINGRDDVGSVAVIMSTPAEKLADEDKLGLDVKRVSASRDYEKTFEQLAEGHADAAVSDKTVAVYMQSFDSNLKILEGSAAEAHYSVAFRSTDEKMRQAADNALKDILGDGSLSELSQKWLGQDYYIK